MVTEPIFVFSPVGLLDKSPRASGTGPLSPADVSSQMGDQLYPLVKTLCTSPPPAAYRGGGTDRAEKLPSSVLPLNVEM